MHTEKMSFKMSFRYGHHDVLIETKSLLNLALAVLLLLLLLLLNKTADIWNHLSITPRKQHFFAKPHGVFDTSAEC